MFRGKALVVMVPLALVVGCGSSGTKAVAPLPPTPTVAVTTTPPPSPTPTPVPKPSPSELGTFYPEAGVSVTFFGYEQPVAVGEQGIEPAGTVFADADVRVCLKVQDTVSQAPWTLRFDDGTQVRPLSSSYSWNPQPQYPFFGTVVAAGTCARGKILFGLPPGTRATSITYSPGNRYIDTWKITR